MQRVRPILWRSEWPAKQSESPVQSSRVFSPHGNEAGMAARRTRAPSHDRGHSTTPRLCQGLCASSHLKIYHRQCGQCDRSYKERVASLTPAVMSRSAVYHQWRTMTGRKRLALLPEAATRYVPVSDHAALSGSRGDFSRHRRLSSFPEASALQRGLQSRHDQRRYMDISTHEGSVTRVGVEQGVKV